MSTTIRPEVSKKNPYYLNRHRYYELVHFCRQYPIWIRARDSLDGLAKNPIKLAAISKKYNMPDPTEKAVESRDAFTTKIELVNKVAAMASSDLKDYLIKGVAEGLSYEILRIQTNIPCNKDEYYKLRRKFFWILNKNKD